MSKRTYVALMGLALAVILATGGLVASNMGFKLNYELAGPGADGTGLNVLSLPYNAQSGINNTGDLLNDIGGTSVVAGVSTFVESDDSFSTYTGGKGEFGDPLNAGEGLFVDMKSTVNYIIAGSHDPGAVVPLNATGAGSATGLNLFSVPYHTTAANTGDLLNDIGGTSVVAGVSTFVEAGDSFSTYTGGKGEFGDPLELGAAVFIEMKSTVNYTPSHY